MNFPHHTDDDATSPLEAAAPRRNRAPRGMVLRVEPVGSLVRHWRTALILFGLVALAGLPLAYYQGRPIYSTQAMLYVSPRLILTAQGVEEFQPPSDGQYRQYLQENIRSIRRVETAREALKRLGGAGRGWWGQPQDDLSERAQRVAAGLSVTTSAESYQLIATLRGGRPDGLAETLNALLDVHISAQRFADQYSLERRQSEATQAASRLSVELSEAQARLEELARLLGVAAFDVPAEKAFAEQGGKVLARAEQTPEERRAAFFRDYAEGTSLTRRVQQLQSQRSGLEAGQSLLNLEQKAPASIRVLSSAPPAQLASRDRRVELAGICLLAALALGLLAPIAMELWNPLLRIPADAERALGLQVAGWLPERAEGGEEFTWELILRLARRMDEERQAHGTRVWMFTSVAAGGGATTLVSSLGKALTILGVPALAIEANALRPDGRYARNSVGEGLCGLLRGHSTLSGNIVPGVAEMPDHIAAGDLCGSRHLPSIHRMTSVFAQAAESYALVLVDLPPLLSSLDAHYLVRRADCAVLVAACGIRISGLKRAGKLLDRLRPQALACVVNRVHSSDGGGFAEQARREFELDPGQPASERLHPWLW
jgi:Mrp family chromosome partitioning ATPase